MTAWKALNEDNERFVVGKPEQPSQSVEHSVTLTQAHRLTAVVFGCADSGVAAEIIFDQGLGDMFVVRPRGYVRDVVERVTPSILLGRPERLTRVDEFEAHHVRQTRVPLISRSTAIAAGVAAGERALVGRTYHLADGRMVLRGCPGDIGGSPGES
ncbi:MAG: carbonic anhydrase [Mycobacterium sp.]|nr:cynT [Mycobacterium sp.]MDT5130855.1 carbonic anhydrase [Mycobacterium sp.]